MRTLFEHLQGAEARRKVIEVYTTSEQTFLDVKMQLSSRNVNVVQTEFTPPNGDEFLVIQNSTKNNSCVLSVETLKKILDPKVQESWELTEHSDSKRDAFDFLDDCLFASSNREDLLVMSREIEERACRSDTGRLIVGFQNVHALKKQLPLYNRLSAERNCTIDVLVSESLDVETHQEVNDEINVHVAQTAEIAQLWVLMFDGGGDPKMKCGLLAEERKESQYYGCLTYNPRIIDEVIEYLKSTYIDT